MQVTYLDIIIVNLLLAWFYKGIFAEPGTEDEGDLHQPPMMSSAKEMGESR